MAQMVGTLTAGQFAIYGGKFQFYEVFVVVYRGLTEV